MSRLIQWLDHRREVVGLENWKDLAELYGVSLQTLSDVQTYHTLNMVNRSERRLLAGALACRCASWNSLSHNNSSAADRRRSAWPPLLVRDGRARRHRKAFAPGPPDSNNRCFSFAI